jgi:hypothetical protein
MGLPSEVDGGGIMPVSQSKLNNVVHVPLTKEKVKGFLLANMAPH